MIDSALLRLAHSPDPDDAFMWWPLVGLGDGGPEVDTGRWRFELVAEDIETLNQQAEEAVYDITAISCAQYPSVRDQYALTACGASLGDGYGPRLVSKTPMDLETFCRETPLTAVPGARTSAVAACRMLLEGRPLPCEVVPFEKIIDEVVADRFEVGLVIHEGQLTFADAGLHLVADLGAWWKSRTDLPLPLGGNAISRDLARQYGPGALEEIAGILRSSVDWAMANKERAIEWALNYGRGIDHATAETFVDMYVNRWTVDVGTTGTQALRVFYKEAQRLGVLQDAGEVDVIGLELLAEDCGQDASQ
ncbi:MAG: ABC transporter substrate-binding protein [Phycisphaerae bacterium]|nr:ABC transporter substrate-binding protein [Phycisphaerae bacterium]|tara:strand:+ start:744 stop:1664 length:921 start_codon:yes stop_codon:yes gene_type:complete